MMHRPSRVITQKKKMTTTAKLISSFVGLAESLSRERCRWEPISTDRIEEIGTSGPGHSKLRRPRRDTPTQYNGKAGINIFPPWCFPRKRLDPGQATEKGSKSAILFRSEERSTHVVECRVGAHWRVPQQEAYIIYLFTFLFIDGKIAFTFRNATGLWWFV